MNNIFFHLRISVFSVISNLLALLANTPDKITDCQPPISKLPEPLKEVITNFLCNHPRLNYLVLLIILLGFLLSQIRKYFQDIEYFVSLVRGRINPNVSEDELLDKRVNYHQRKLLKKVKEEIKERLECNLYKFVKIDDRLKETIQQDNSNQLIQVETELGIVKILNQWFKKLKEENPSQPLQLSTQNTSAIFARNDIEGRLLILGKPGSGKTTELLSLAQDLIDRANSNQNCEIPIIFELSTWRSNQSIIDWLIEQIEDLYKINKTIGKQLIKKQRIITLLDGLDELESNNKEKCIVKLNEFLQNYFEQKMVVCCRQEEYEIAENKIEELNGVVYVEELTEAQIKQYLKKLDSYDLWKINIKNSPEMLELSRIPLFLNLLSLTYQGRVTTTKQELFNAYIEKQFNNVRIELYSPKKTKHYLKYLAEQLRKKSQTEFFIEKMQFNWLETETQKRKYWLILGLIGGLILGLSDIPSSNIKIGLSVGLLYGIVFGLIGRTIIKLVRKIDRGLLGGILFGLFMGVIFQLVGKFIFNLLFKQNFGLFGGLVGGVVCGLIFDLIENLEPVDKIQFSRISWKKIGISLFVWLIAVFIFGTITYLSHEPAFANTRAIVGLFFGLFASLNFGLRAKNENKTFPNQGIWGSAKNALKLALFSSAIFALIYYPIARIIGFPVSLNALLKSCFTLGIWVGFTSSGLVCIQHFSLRFVLWQSRLIPWNYAHFLKYASSLKFIQRVGGRYRFIHDLLRKHFSEIPR